MDRGMLRIWVGLALMAIVIVGCGIAVISLHLSNSNDVGTQPTTSCIKTNEKFEELFNTTITGATLSRRGYAKPIICDIENNKYVAMDSTFFDYINCQGRYRAENISLNVTIYHKSGMVFHSTVRDMYRDRYYGQAVQADGSSFAIDGAYDVIVNYTALELKWDTEWEDCFTYPNKTYAVFNVTADVKCNTERCYPVYDVWYDDNKTLQHIRLPSDIRYPIITNRTRTHECIEHVLTDCVLSNESKLVLVEIFSDSNYQRSRWELHVTPEMLE